MSGGMGVAIPQSGTMKRKFHSLDQSILFQSLLVNTDFPMVLVVEPKDPQEVLQPESQPDVVLSPVDLPAVDPDHVRSTLRRRDAEQACAAQLRTSLLASVRSSLCLRVCVDAAQASGRSRTWARRCWPRRPRSSAATLDGRP